MAFNAKNLQYDKREPAFLRKLKGEFSGLDGRHNVQIARPKKDRLKTGGDDEDEPVIVDEQGERIEKVEFERRAKGDDEAENPASTDNGNDPQAVAGESAKQKVLEIGSVAVAKKRKVGKIVGGEEESARDSTIESPGGQKDSAKAKSDKVPQAKKDVATPNKKTKKIKLSFNEPE